MPVLAKIAEDVLLSLNRSLSNVQGQCYDGAATMAGRKGGLAKLIMDEEPHAINGHSLNLVANEVFFMNTVLELTHELPRLYFELTHVTAKTVLELTHELQRLYLNLPM